MTQRSLSLPVVAPARVVLPAVLLATALVELGGLSIGWWWVTTATGFAVVVLVRGIAMLGVLLAGTVLAWAGALSWQSGSRTVDVADLLGAMVFHGRGLGWLILIITFVYSVLLALAGAWLGAAVRRALVARQGGDPGTEPASEPAISTVLSEQKNEEQEHV